MKIIITENQYNNLTQEKIKNFLFKLWDRQQENGEEPNLDEIIYDVLDINYGSEMDHKLVRPLWYEYNGGSEKVINKIKDQILGKVFKTWLMRKGLKSKYPKLFAFGFLLKGSLNSLQKFSLPGISFKVCLL